MIPKILVVIYSVSWVVVMICMVLAIYHFANAIFQIKGNRSFLANIAAPLTLAMKSCFTEKGNYHRRKFGQYIFSLIVCVLILVSIDTYMN